MLTKTYPVVKAKSACALMILGCGVWTAHLLKKVCGYINCIKNCSCTCNMTGWIHLTNNDLDQTGKPTIFCFKFQLPYNIHK